MFRMCERMALCIQRRISPPRALHSSPIASSASLDLSLDHPPRTSMMMLYILPYVISLRNCCLSSQQKGPYLAVFSSCFFFFFRRPQVAHFYRQNSLLLVIYKSCIHSLVPDLLSYCKHWNIPICLSVGWLVNGFGNDRRIPRWHCIRELKLSKHFLEQYFEGRGMTHKVLILCKCRISTSNIL